jgi:hypothetical protein
MGGNEVQDSMYDRHFDYTQLMQELSNEGAGARVSEPQRARSGSRHKAFFHQLSSSPLNLFRPVDEY